MSRRIDHQQLVLRKEPSSGPRPHASSDQERLQLLIDAVIDYAIYMLDVDGRIVSWNSGAQRLKGYTPAEIVGQHFDRFYTPEDRAAGVPKTAPSASR